MKPLRVIETREFASVAEGVAAFEAEGFVVFDEIADVSGEIASGSGVLLRNGAREAFVRPASTKTRRFVLASVINL